MLRFEKLQVRSRLALISAVSVIGLVVIGIFSAYKLRENIVVERYEKIRGLVETAHAVLAHYEQQAASGQMSPEAAREAALGAVRAMRYDGSEYFWIHDAEHRMVMHPIKPELEGKVLDELKDKGGKRLFVEMSQLVKAKGAGYVDYLWSKPGQEAPAPKVSYVKGFAPWGWIVGTGVYVDDIDATFRHQAGIMGGMGLAVLVLLTFLSWRVNRSILRQLGGEPSYASQVVADIAAGDLASRVHCDGADPDSLLAAMSSMQQKLTQMFKEISNMAATLSGNAEQVATAAREIGLASHNQAQSTAASAASIEQLTVSIGEVSQVVSQTEANSSETAKLAADGARLVKETAEEIDLIAQTVNQSSTQIQALLQRSQEIGGIANVIKEIADQTNLLALNAAIEAARAGEQGRGFAVVADEVRKLAERTSSATTEIARMIEAIQTETRTAVEAMETAAPQVEKGKNHAQQATAMLDEIHRQALDSLAKVRDVANATREQVTTATDIARHVEHIATMAEETNATMQNNADAAQKLEELADGLRSSIAYFRVA